MLHRWASSHLTSARQCWGSSRDSCLQGVPSCPCATASRFAHSSGQGARAECHCTMISMELQRDVPQYIAIPWLMTWVMARTVSVVREGETWVGAAGTQAQPGDILQIQAGRWEEGGLQRCLASSVLPGSELGVCVCGSRSKEKREPQSKKLVLETISPASSKPNGISEKWTVGQLRCLDGRLEGPRMSGL